MNYKIDKKILYISIIWYIASYIYVFGVGLGFCFDKYENCNLLSLIQQSSFFQKILLLTFGLPGMSQELLSLIPDIPNYIIGGLIAWFLPATIGTLIAYSIVSVIFKIFFSLKGR